METVAPGIWKMTFGAPEELTPVKCLKHTIRENGLESLPECGTPPFDAEDIRRKTTERGFVLELPLRDDEQLYGFGLQLKSFNQRGRKKHIRVNADPIADSGDSHAPVPFFASTGGYAVLVDTYRYASFFCGNSRKKAASQADQSRGIGGSTEELYAVKDNEQGCAITIDIPHAKGADIYVFSGPGMREAVQRYILFSGGGCLPPAWGLGVLYRAYAKADGDKVLTLAEQIRADGMPCDMLGLEPGWQSHSYPCSLKWDDERFPKPDELIQKLNGMGFSVNLWEHAFLHHTSPLHGEFLQRSGDYEGMGGLAPDFLDEEASGIFSRYHKEQFFEKGVSGFKLDECDNSDYTGGWSFPECSEFPSGIDGEQMHSAFGLLYQRSVLAAAEASGVRTYGLVRSSHALAAPLPFVLYSDLYDHNDFIRGLVNAGFSGLLWTPEVRQCDSVEDLIRRIQTVVFSPQVCINAWMIPHPPWKQVDYDKNLRGEFLDNVADVQAECRFWLELRMRLIPYLYSAFMKYFTEGLPPFRAFVMDWPEDPETYGVDNEYMMGDFMLVAPLTAGQHCRKVYLPKGSWYSFWTNEKLVGGRSIEVVDSGKIPVFIRENSLLPLARPMQHISPDACFDIDATCYGSRCAEFTLYEDDFTTLSYLKGETNSVRLTYDNSSGRVERSGSFSGKRYKIQSWTSIE